MLELRAWVVLFSWRPARRSLWLGCAVLLAPSAALAVAVFLVAVKSLVRQVVPRCGRICMVFCHHVFMLQCVPVMSFAVPAVRVLCRACGVRAIVCPSCVRMYLSCCIVRC